MSSANNIYLFAFLGTAPHARKAWRRGHDNCNELHLL